MARNQFTWVSFFLRFAFSLVLVFATYNAFGYSWFDLLSHDIALVYKIAPGLVLLIGWVIYLRATWNSLGAFGMVLATGLMGVLVWLLYEWGILKLDNASVIVTLVEAIIAWVLAVGISWSHVRRRLSGQYDTDEIE